MRRLSSSFGNSKKAGGANAKETSSSKSGSGSSGGSSSLGDENAKLLEERDSLRLALNVLEKRHEQEVKILKEKCEVFRRQSVSGGGYIKVGTAAGGTGSGISGSNGATSPTGSGSTELELLILKLERENADLKIELDKERNKSMPAGSSSEELSQEKAANKRTAKRDALQLFREAYAFNLELIEKAERENLGIAAKIEALEAERKDIPETRESEERELREKPVGEQESEDDTSATTEGPRGSYTEDRAQGEQLSEFSNKPTESTKKEKEKDKEKARREPREKEEKEVVKDEEGLEELMMKERKGEGKEKRSSRSKTKKKGSVRGGSKLKHSRSALPAKEVKGTKQGEKLSARQEKKMVAAQLAAQLAAQDEDAHAASNEFSESE